MSFKQQFIGYLSLTRKEIWRIVRVWLQTVSAPLITSILYFVVFGKVIGARVGPIDNVEYIQFIIPGMVMMQIILLSYANTTSTVFSAKFNKSIEEVLVSPLTNGLILLAYTTAGLFRAIVTGVIISLTALFFANLHIKHLPFMIIAVTATSVIFSSLGMLNSLYAKRFDDISVIPTFVLMPLTYLAGVFYPVSSLPQIWHYLSLLNPIVYAIDMFRYSMLGIDATHPILALFLLTLIAVIAYGLCLLALNKGVGLRE